MTKPVPINSLNAIEASAIALLFDRQFTPEEDVQLQRLEAELKEDFPSFSRNTLVQARIEKDKLIEHSSQQMGVTLQHFNADGKPTRVLQIQDNQLVISCFAYDRWEQVWGRAQKYLKAATACLNLAELGVTGLGLQYVDKFTQPIASDYNISDVFNKDSKYLTANSALVGKFWHVHQGWFVPVEETRRILNVLNVGTQELGGNLFTIIDHTSTLQLRNPVPADQFLGNGFSEIVNQLHIDNKEIIKALLNAKQLSAIGM